MLLLEAELTTTITCPCLCTREPVCKGNAHPTPLTASTGAATEVYFYHDSLLIIKLRSSICRCHRMSRIL